MTTDSSIRTETGLRLNNVSLPAPGNVPNMRGILIRSRCHPHFAVYDIQKFFRSVLTSVKDSFLRIMCVLSNFFSSAPTPNPTWRFFRDQAIPFGDSASGNYATCAKIATVQTFIHDSPPPPPPCYPPSCTGGHLHWWLRGGRWLPRRALYSLTRNRKNSQQRWFLD